MNANDLLKLFEHIPRGELHQIRSSTRLDSLPTAQTTYLNIVNEAFPDQLTDELLTDVAFDERQRITHILGELLIRDGRAFHAIIGIASRASNEQAVYNSNAVNALAHLHVYLIHRRGLVPMADSQLIERLKELCEIEDTCNNASGITKFLRDRN